MASRYLNLQSQPEGGMEINKKRFLRGTPGAVTKHDQEESYRAL